MLHLVSVCNFLKYVTLFSCDTFGFYVSWVYLQYGIQVITRQFQFAEINSTEEQGVLVSIIVAILMLVTAFLFDSLSRTSYFHRHIRRFLADYGMPISLVASSGMAYWGRFNAANPLTLPIGRAFHAANDRSWLVNFWELEGKWVGIAFPFGLILWLLFFFDHNVSVSSNSILKPLFKFSFLFRSLLWPKVLNFPCENLRDFTTISFSSASRLSSRVYWVFRLLMDLYHRLRFTLRPLQ